MSLVAAIDEVEPDQVENYGILDSPQGTGQITSLLSASVDTPNSPTAFLNRYYPGRLSSAHFHVVDQFQILVDGLGEFGRHSVAPYSVHFSRAHTPYGPLRTETGCAFLTLRTRYDPGSQRLFDKLRGIPGRQPWQITKKIAFPPQGSGISLQDIAEIKDEQGLYVCSLTMAPDTRTAAPDPSAGDGQYVVIVKGSGTRWKDVPDSWTCPDCSASKIDFQMTEI